MCSALIYVVSFIVVNFGATLGRQTLPAKRAVNNSGKYDLTDRQTINNPATQRSGPVCGWQGRLARRQCFHAVITHKTFSTHLSARLHVAELSQFSTLSAIAARSTGSIFVGGASSSPSRGRGSLRLFRDGNLEKRRGADSSVLRERAAACILPRAFSLFLFLSVSPSPTFSLSLSLSHVLSRCLPFSHFLCTGRTRSYFGDTYLLREERPMCTYVRRHLHTAGVGTVGVRARASCLAQAQTE